MLDRRGFKTKAVYTWISQLDHKQSIFKKEDLRFLSLVPASSLPIHTHMNYLADSVFKQELLELNFTNPYLYVAGQSEDCH